MRYLKIESLWTGAIVALLSLIACTGQDPRLNGAEIEGPLSGLASYPSQPANFRVSLTDAPAKDLTSVFVNVTSVELWLEKGGKQARAILNKNLGLIDLMTLRNGVLLPIEDLYIPAGVRVKQIRLIVGSGNYAVKTDESTCELKTPSAQQSGIKIILKNPVTVEDSYAYSLVVDFDAEKSVVMTGQGCLLKPVLKIAGFTRLPSDTLPDDEGEMPPGEDLTGGEPPGNEPGGENDDGETDEDGYDTSNPGGWPPGYEPIYIPQYFEGT